MSGLVEWPALLFISGLIVGLVLGACGLVLVAVRLAWWLSEEFKDTRHSLNNAIFGAIGPIREDLDALKEDVVRLKTMINGKH